MGALLLAIAFVKPYLLGGLGSWLKIFTLRVFGFGAYLSPGFVFWISRNAWRLAEEKWKLSDFMGRVLALPLSGFLLISVFLGYLLRHHPDIAGIVPLEFLSPMEQAVGAIGSGILLVGCIAFWSSAAFEVSWLGLIKRALSVLYEDWISWRRQKSLEQKTEAAYATTLTNGNKTEPAKPNPPKSQLFQEKAKVVEDKPIRKIIPTGSWKLPPLDLLIPSDSKGGSRDVIELSKTRAQDLIRAMASFDVQVELASVVPGPVITRYDVIPQTGVKVGEISALSNDIALALKVASVRILGPIAGKGAIGIEVPNESAELVRLREALEEPAFSQSGDLVFALGRAADGEAVVCDLVDMPHLLVAGATNSGKSVLIHSLIVSFLYRLTPDQLKLVLIDPKRLELPFYAGVPHLFDPRKRASEVGVITDAKEASRTLNALVDLMEYRYEKFSAKSVRNIASYNEAAQKKNEPLESYVVVIIDELADLMLIAGREVETTIQRLAQMARAVGIHLVLATQRPSVDVITGVIKANLPARIALQVVSKTDSRVILDTNGAEELLGAGDMLYLSSGAPRPVRLQGALVTDEEIQKVVGFWKEQGSPSYAEPNELLGREQEGPEGATKEDQENLAKALSLVLERRRVSQDLLKARFGSSAKASDMLSRLEIGGFVFKPEGTNRWEIRFDKIEDYLNGLKPHF